MKAYKGRGAASELTCMAVGRGFGASLPGPFPRKEKEREREAAAFLNLSLGVTCHLFHHVLLVIHTDYGSEQQS